VTAPRRDGGQGMTGGREGEAATASAVWAWFDVRVELTQQPRAGTSTHVDKG
jgi:hypothetical protein